MTGLEKILDEIKKESNKEIEKIESEAKKIAEDMIKVQENKIKVMKENLEQELEKNTKLDIEKGISSAISNKKKIILKQKQSIIADIIEKSKEYIKNLPKEEYISFLEKIALSYAHSEDGLIRLTKNDKESIADELLIKINSKLKENGKGTLSLDDKISNEKTGFIMVYNDVEENCSLEAIFSEKRELLEDKLNSFLFE